MKVSRFLSIQRILKKLYVQPTSIPINTPAPQKGIGHLLENRLQVRVAAKKSAPVRNAPVMSAK